MDDVKIQVNDTTITITGAELTAAQALSLANGLRAAARGLEDRQGARREAAVPPADRSQQVLTDGTPVPADRSHTELRPDGQQKGYIVLTAEERAKGFIRPVRRSYRHLKCGQVTTMGTAIAETYARDPGFYTGTFCTACGYHYPIETHGQEGEFVWLDGSKVGS